MAGVASQPEEINLSNNRLSAVLSDNSMASDVSGMTSYESTERELVKLQAEVTLQEEVTRLAQKRLAIKVLEAEIQSTSNIFVRSCDMRSPGILSPPMKIHRAGNGGGGPPDNGPNGNDVSQENDSCPSTVYKPSPSASPAAPIIEEAGTTTSRIELPVSTLNEESLIRLQLFPPQTQEFSIHTPVMSSADTAHRDKILFAQQEFLCEEADAERMRPNKQELVLDQGRSNIGADQERLMIVAGKVQKQSENNALHTAMAEQRIKDEEHKADTEFRAAENKICSTRFNLQEEAEHAWRVIKAEEATQRLRALDLERQHDFNTNEQKLRDESIARNMQQRLIELEHQSRATTEDLVNLSELNQKEIALQEECACKGRLRTQFKEEERRVRALAESVVIEKENTMQIAFGEKYQSPFNVMQAELANQFAVFQTERERMKRDWYDFTNSKDKETETLKLRFQEAQRPLAKLVGLVLLTTCLSLLQPQVLSLRWLLGLFGKRMIPSHLIGQGAMAAVAAMEATWATLAIPGAPDSLLVMIIINLTPGTRVAPMILVPQTTLGMPIPLLPSH